MSLILPGLYIGDIELARNKETLDYMKCTHILVTTNTIDPLFPEVILCLKLIRFLNTNKLELMICPMKI